MPEAVSNSVSNNDIELEDLPEVDEAENQERHSSTTLDALPTNATARETESPTIERNPLEGISHNDTSNAKGIISCTASTAIGTWIGAALAIGALIVAIYYGYWSLSLQRWSALKDFRSQCQDAEKSNISTPECTAVLALPPVPPPVAKRFAQRLYDCVAFRPGCSEEVGPVQVLARRSISGHRKPWWLLLIQTIGLLISVSVLALLQYVPPERLRAAIHSYLGDRGMLLLKTILTYCRVVTWETCLFLSCFSPLYAIRVWWMFRKRMRFSSIIALTYIGGAFSVYYVYCSRVAGNIQRRSRERSWKVDAQSVEQQVWTSPDGVHVTRLHEETANEIAVEFQSGLKRRHR